MFCSKCGVQIEENEQVCQNCKESIVNEEVDCVENVVTENVNVPVAAKGKLYDILLLAAAALMALGTLLPCYTISMFGFSESFSYIEGDGIFVIIAAVIIAVLYFLKKDKFAYIPAAVAGIVLIVFSVNASDVGMGSFGIGFFAMWIGTIAAIALPFTPLAKK